MIWILLIFALCGFRPMHATYDTPQKISDEFQNVEGDVQWKQFKVFNSTPNLSDLNDGEIVIFSSGATKIMWRQSNEIYAVQGSCITIRR